MPVFDASQGFEQACAWYWNNSKFEQHKKENG